MNRSTLLRFEEIGCERRSRTFIFEFKARRVAGYTIPQKHCRFLIADCRLVSNARSQLEIGNWQSKMRVVAVEGIEPTSLDYQSSALAFELHREVVDPTGLKPAPHGLKVRRSVTRAPGQQEKFRVWSSEFRV